MGYREEDGYDGRARRTRRRSDDDRQPPVTEYRGRSGAPRDDRGPVEWAEVYTLTGEPDQRGNMPALRVTESTNRGTPAWHSFTFGLMKNGEFVPVQHLRDLHIKEYLRMLEEAAHRSERAKSV